MKSRVIYFAYRILAAVLLPAVLFYFLVRAVRNRSYFPTVWQRLGFLPREYQQTGGGAVWFHAVSVGEAIAIGPLVARVRELLPHAPIFISSTTVAGYRAAREKLGSFADGIFYAPVDYAWAVRRVLRQIRPSVVAVVETEIWPVLFRETRNSHAALLIVNGRISDRAAPRYIRACWFFHAILRQTTAILVQSEAMRERFLLAGAPPERVAVGGNLKYDLEPEPVSAKSPVRGFLAGAKVWIAASTTEDGELEEEDAVIAAWQKLSGWKLVLAPRQPGRFDHVARKLDDAGIRFARRTRLEEGDSGDVLLLDTVGELAGLFALADAVFVGGSLSKCGGHNVLEPAWFGKTITVGPHMENFREIAAEFRAGVAFHEIETAAELTPHVDLEMGERARACARRNGGATEVAAQKICSCYGEALPRVPRSLPARLFLGPLTWLWRWGGSYRLHRAWTNRQKLGVPVISIGNITVGGTGKTPTVMHLARLFSDSGLRPGVLTRGYGRASPHELLILNRGGQASRAHTGDEAQILLRSGLVSMGVGADRAEAGRQLQERGFADILLLDDGFQHVRVARNFDLVLIDALDPFGGWNLMPLGRMREPMRGLERASAFLITRLGPGSPAGAIEEQLRRCNSAAPVFRSRVVPGEWSILIPETDTRRLICPLRVPWRSAGSEIRGPSGTHCENWGSPLLKS